MPLRSSRVRIFPIFIGCAVLLALFLIPSFGAVDVLSKPVIGGCSQLSPRQVPPIGRSGAIRFDCGSKPAFSATGNATPMFNLATTGYQSLAIVPHSSSSCSSSAPIQSGQKVSFGGHVREFDYCAFFNDPLKPGLRSFDLQWSVSK